ncbi:hypothetical protein AVEN_65709-1, partial [Araneus ventricosus]
MYRVTCIRWGSQVYHSQGPGMAALPITHMPSPVKLHSPAIRLAGWESDITSFVTIYFLCATLEFRLQSELESR